LNVYRVLTKANKKLLVTVALTESMKHSTASR